MRSKSFELLHSLRETPIGHEISVKECFYILNLEISLLEVVGHVPIASRKKVLEMRFVASNRKVLEMVCEN